MKSVIVAAETTPQQDRLDEVIDGLSDNFDYVVDGLKMLGRGDNESIDDAIAIAHTLESGIDAAMQAVAARIQGGSNEA